MSAAGDLPQLGIESVPVRKSASHGEAGYGNYILYSLLGAFIVAGGGFGATKIYKFGDVELLGRYSGARTGTSIQAIVNCASKNTRFIDCSSVGGSALAIRPNTVLRHEFGPCLTLTIGTPAAIKTPTNSRENMYASASPDSNSIRTSRLFATPSIPRRRAIHCSSERCRQTVNRSISAVRSRASAASFSNFAARVIASADSAFAATDCIIAMAAASCASATRSFDLLRSSVWIRLFRIPNRTSPTIPNAIAALVTADSLKKILYGGASQSTNNSAITAATTSAPQPTPHHSHDDDASSSWLSAACFIVPRGRYHAGKSGFRTFLLGLLFWSLTIGFLLWLIA